MSTLTVDRILAAPKVTLDKSVYSYYWQEFDSSESYGYSVKKVADPLD